MSQVGPTRGKQQPVERFAATGGRLTGYFGVLLAVAVLGYVAWTVHTPTGLSVALAAAFAGLLVYATQLRPRATAYPGHVVLHNSFRDTHVPYSVIDEVALGQTLAVWVGEQRYVCIGIGNSLREDFRAQRRREQTVGSSRLTELSLRAERADNDARAMSYQTFVVNRLEELIAQARRDRIPSPPGPRQVTAWPEVAGLAVTGVALVLSLLL
jgi:hypothetical protein